MIEPNTIEYLNYIYITNGLSDSEKLALAEVSTSRDQLKAEYLATLATLTDIENATSPTNAQVIAAVKFLAKTLRLLLKLLARMI